MIITGRPQFETQDDDGMGLGIPPIAEWQLDSAAFDDDLSELGDIEIDYAVRNVFIRLRHVFGRAKRVPITTTKVHDLACFVVHRLLLSAPDTAGPRKSPVTECIRYGVILYMFHLQGTTYFSHAAILGTLTTRFVEHVEQLEQTPHGNSALITWCLAVGMLASAEREKYQWFRDRSRALAISLQLGSWDEVFLQIRSVLWLETPQGEGIFRSHWDALLGIPRPSTPAGLAAETSPDIPHNGFV